MTSSVYWTPVGTNPIKQWNYKLVAANVDGGITSFGLAMKVVVEYDILFTVPID